MNHLEKAIIIAVQAHAGQQDKGGQPYILHPLRLMLSVEGETEKIIAVLHDVLEDSDVTREELYQNGFSEEVLAALDCLTRRDTETYEDFIERIRENTLASRVKKADLQDNMNLERIPQPTSKDYERVEKYTKALARLGQ